MYLYVCLYFKSLLAVVQFAKNPAFSPTFYKFIVLGSLGSYPKSFGFGLQIVTLQEPILEFLFFNLNTMWLYQTFIYLFLTEIFIKNIWDKNNMPLHIG